MEGKLEGKLEGKVEGKAEAIQTILEQKFGPLDKSTQVILQQADSEQLQSILQRIEELFAFES